MAFIIIGVWMALLWLLVKLNVLKGWAMWMKISPIVIYALYFLIIAIPMNFTAPSGAAMVLRESVSINPAVSGPVTEVMATSGVIVEKGAPLFQIDRAPYEAKAASLEAKLALAETRLAQAKELIVKQAGREFDVQTYEAEVAQLKADLESAKLNLERTLVAAPARGFVPHVALQPGVQVAPPPSGAVMTFIQTDEVALAVQVQQAYIRHVEVGQKVDVVLKLFPGTVHEATVERVVEANPQGQIALTGRAIDSSTWSEQPFLVELVPGESLDLGALPAGAYGTAAIYTSDRSTFGEIIRAIMLRVETWMNFI